MVRWLGALVLVLGCSSKERTELPVGGGAAGSSAGSAASAAGTAAAAGQGATATGGTNGGSGAATAGASGTSPQGGSGTSGGAAATPDAAVGTDAMPGADGAPDMSRGTGPGDWGPGDYPPNLMSADWLEISGVPGQGQNVRQYKVHVPPSYQPDVPTPLVFCIHGLGQDALLFCVTGTAMHTKSDQAGFILVMPNGYQNSWNAGTCCGAASTEQLDEVALFRAIFTEVGEHVNVDLDRVYATGLSNGGYMSYRLACEAADLFTAVAPVAGAIGINDIGGGTNPNSNFTTCMPSQPISVLHTHGTQDPLIPFSLQAPTMSRMAMNNGCATATSPAALPASGGDTTCVTHNDCPSGIELTACTIQGGGHCWFGSPDCGTGGGAIGMAIVGANSDTMKNTDAAWAFFERLSR
jgi:polyhydroxybutyrate depolymerase